jgi:hypothetical protein
MAVIHPEDRIAGLERANRDHTKKLHPAFGLAMGFGFIVVVASLVHVLFAAV